MVQDELPPEAAALDADQRAFLGRLGQGLEEGMDGQAIHDLIWELARGVEGTKPALLFQAIYLPLLGQTRGPRAGWFIALLGPAFCAGRFKQAASP